MRYKHFNAELLTKTSLYKMALYINIFASLVKRKINEQQLT